MAPDTLPALAAHHGGHVIHLLAQGSVVGTAAGAVLTQAEAIVSINIDIAPLASWELTQLQEWSKHVTILGVLAQPGAQHGPAWR